MGKLTRSRLVAWAALAVVVTVICLTFSMRGEWWCFIDIFFAFMMVFCHLLALYLGKMSPVACRKLDFLALVFGILTVLAIVGEYISMSMI